MAGTSFQMTWMEVELTTVALTLLGGLEGAVMEESKTESITELNLMHTSSFHPALTSLTGPESDSGTEWPFSNLCVCPYSDVVLDIFLKILKKNFKSGIISDIGSCS